VQNNATENVEMDLAMNEYRLQYGNIYTRLYLGMDKNDRPFLFLDCIEAEDIAWQSIKEYKENDVHDLLVGSLATAIGFAQALGIDRLACGEPEVTELMQAIGGKEQRYFTKQENNYEQKLGLCGSDSYTEGTYVWRMDSSRSFYTLDTTILQPNILDTIYTDMDAITERIESYPKTQKTLQKSYTAYKEQLQMLEPLLAIYDSEYTDKINRFARSMPAT